MAAALLGRAAFDAQLKVYRQDKCVTTLSPTLPYEIQVGSPAYLGGLRSPMIGDRPLASSERAKLYDRELFLEDDEAKKAAL